MHDLRSDHNLRSDLRAKEAAATPGPWALRQEGGTFVVQNHSTLIESGLSEPFATYFVTLRNAAATVLASDRHVPKRLRDALDAAMRAVNSDWVFVAPLDKGERYFMHNCVVRVGLGQLGRADALFLDAAKAALPLLLSSQRESFAEGRSSSADVGDTCRRLFIPRRMTASDTAGDYDAFAHEQRPLHALSGRFELHERTNAMIDAILAHVAFAPGHRVLDIGCGDATLLRRLAPRVARAVGTVLSERERRKLASDPALKGIDIAAASFDDLDRIEGPFDRIIANGCLHFVKTATGADRAFAKLAALLAPGGQIWAGELHATDYRRLTFTSKLAALRHVHARHGRPFAFAFARHLWRHRRHAHTIIERGPGEWWHVRRDELAKLAARHGLAVEGAWTCTDLTGDTFYAMQNRYCCLLTRR